MQLKDWAILAGIICIVLPVIITCVLYGAVLVIIWLFGERVEEE